MGDWHVQSGNHPDPFITRDSAPSAPVVPSLRPVDETGPRSTDLSDAAPGGAGLTPGSKHDFEELYRSSYNRILATLVAVLGDRAGAEDCAQETYIRAFRAWDRWTPDAAPETWLHRIAINVANSYRDRQRLREVGEVLKRIGPPREARHPAEIAEQNEVIRALAQIPPEQSAALVLRHYHGYTNREIAYALRIPERTVASRLAKAKDRLRKVAGLPDGAAGEVAE